MKLHSNEILVGGEVYVPGGSTTIGNLGFYRLRVLVSNFEKSLSTVLHSGSCSSSRTCPPAFFLLLESPSEGEVVDGWVEGSGGDAPGEGRGRSLFPDTLGDTRHVEGQGGDSGLRYPLPSPPLSPELSDFPSETVQETDPRSSHEGNCDTREVRGGKGGFESRTRNEMTKDELGCYVRVVWTLKDFQGLRLSRTPPC